MQNRSLEFECPSVFIGVACDTIVHHFVRVLAFGIVALSRMIVLSFGTHPCTAELHETRLCSKLFGVPAFGIDTLIWALSWLV
jgi:hypothetical protein